MMRTREMKDIGDNGIGPMIQLLLAEFGPVGPHCPIKVTISQSWTVQ